MEMSGSSKGVAIASLILVVIVIIGTIGFTIFEKWSPFEAFWQTIITMSTVGFGETHPMHASGRWLAIFIIISTLLVGGYALGSINAFLVGGEIGLILKGKKMEKDLSKLTNHTIQIAYGRVGREAAEGCKPGKLVIIDRDPARVAEATEHGYLTIEGDATQDSILLKAGIKRAKSLLVASGHIADNVLICLTAREFNPEILIVARGDDRGSESKLRRAGANRVVLPNQIGGHRLAAFIKQPAVVDFLDFMMHGDDLNLRLQELNVAQGSAIVGKTLRDSDLRKKSDGALVMSVVKENKERITAPSFDYVIEGGDKLIILGTAEAIGIVEKMVS